MLELTDNSQLPLRTKDKGAMIQKRLYDLFDKNKKWFTANYFLTNDNYCLRISCKNGWFKIVKLLIIYFSRCLLNYSNIK